MPGLHGGLPGGDRQFPGLPVSQAHTLGLRQSVCKGLKEGAAAQAKVLAESGQAVLDIINGELVPALDEVGKGFEKGTLFLPQLLMSAEAAKAAFQVLKEYLPAGENSGAPQILLATVKGDIHDIGKNIVKVLLESYRFRVLDLGKDVAPEAIVEAARTKKIPLVGLSALMTTTAPAMAETIRQLRAADLPCKVVVGGAVITQDYADTIGLTAMPLTPWSRSTMPSRSWGHKREEASEKRQDAAGFPAASFVYKG